MYNQANIEFEFDGFHFIHNIGKLIIKTVNIHELNNLSLKVIDSKGESKNYIDYETINELKNNGFAEILIAKELGTILPLTILVLIDDVEVDSFTIEDIGTSKNPFLR